MVLGIPYNDPDTGVRIVFRQDATVQNKTGAEAERCRGIAERRSDFDALVVDARERETLEHNEAFMRAVSGIEIIWLANGKVGRRDGDVMVEGPRGKVMVMSGSSADQDEAARTSTDALVPAISHAERLVFNSQDNPMEHVVPNVDIEIDEMETGEPWPENESEIVERQQMKLRAFRRAPSMDIRQWAPHVTAYWKRREAERQAREASPTKLPGADDILTPDQAASTLQIPKKTVIALCAQGRLAGAFKAGRRWRIPGRAVRLMAGEENRRCR